MKPIKLTIVLALLFVSLVAQGGGIVTNTNQSAAWVRMFARDASRDLDAVYYNPAGLTALPKGLYFSANNLSLFSTRTIKNNYSALNSSEYTGDVSAPVFPTFYAIYRTGKIAVSFGFNPVGGGGNATYDKGLPSFELGVADLKPALAPKGVTGYSSDVYFKGSSIFYGGQLGVSYKINDMISVFAGGRYVYAVNKYQGHLNNNIIYGDAAKLGAASMPASTFFNGASAQAGLGAAGVQPLETGGLGSLTLAQAQALGYVSAAQKTQIEGGLMSLGVNPTNLTIEQVLGKYKLKSLDYANKAKLLRNQSADVTQTGSGFNPIIGANINLMEGKLNIGLKYEFMTKISLTNDTKMDITTGYVIDTVRTTSPTRNISYVNVDSVTQFPNKAKTPSDMPALFTIGASYQLFKNLKVSAGFHYYFDKNANYGRSQNGVVVENNSVIQTNNFEFALGAEYSLTDKILLSTGYLYTKTGVMVGYNTDLSYSLGSNSFGLGGKVAISPKVDVELGASYTWYIPSYKYYDHTIPTIPSQTVQLKEKYYKDVLILAVGINIKLSKAE